MARDTNPNFMAGVPELMILRLPQRWTALAHAIQSVIKGSHRATIS